MRLRSLLVATLGLLIANSQASAHFVWLAVANDSSGQPAAHVWFGELAEPDDAELLDKIAAVKVWTRSASEKPASLKLTKTVEEGGGALVGIVPEGTAALGGTIEYGVLTRRDQTFLLQYHAKYLNAGAPALKALARDESLVLDIVPQRSGKGYSLEVLYQGKPVEGSEVAILDPTARETEAKTDAQGRVQLETAKPGLYSIRAKWIVEQEGTSGDKEYKQVNHYSTLALQVPQAQP